MLFCGPRRSAEPPRKTFAIALGCDLQHAGRLVYSDGLDLSNPAAVTPIGRGCRICERPACRSGHSPQPDVPCKSTKTAAPAPYAVS
ncbi:short-chain fatty acyl-CoA regulator family protein [Bradyrhizobium liaoningense]|uniref:short-chain fatty acyl-CoA regulator family protein n=1 Tax=Bradyrhizobium liaoningense TaxID=43992 RepID=UPI00387E1A06